MEFNFRSGWRSKPILIQMLALTSPACNMSDLSFSISAPTSAPTATPISTPAIDIYKRVSPSVVNITTQVLRRSFFFEVILAEGADSDFVLNSDDHPGEPAQ